MPADRPARRRRAISRPVALAATVLLTAVSGAACAAGNGSTGTAGAPSSASTTAPTSYPSIAALDQALVDHGITCTLEYQGLRDDVSNQEVSLCTIDQEQAYLRIWLAPDKLAAFVASPEGGTGTVAVGANWTVTVASPAVAGKVAAALGGSVPTSVGSTLVR